MKWTTFDPVEGQKYIVETNTGCVFPAHVINGTWWNYERAFPIDGVTRWIPYPVGGSANDDIPVEVLFKYVCRDFKNMKEIAKGESEKVGILKDLNKQLVSDCNALCDEIKQLKQELANKESNHEEEVKKLYDLIHEISAERDALKEQVKQQGQFKVQSEQEVSSKELIRENKQMKAFLRSIMNTCDTMRELEIA